MDIQLTAHLQESPYAALAAQKSDLVRAEINGAAAGGIWDLRDDPYGRPEVVLRFRDAERQSGSVAFMPHELGREPVVVLRLQAVKDGLVRIERWHDELRQFYATIRQWCQDLPGPITIREEPVMFNEVASGEYEVTRLIIQRGERNKMRVEPVAAWTFGADGRVDFWGGDGPFYIMYSRTAGWYHLEESPPITTHPLTRELFRQLAGACLYV